MNSKRTNAVLAAPVHHDAVMRLGTTNTFSRFKLNLERFWDKIKILEGGGKQNQEARIEMATFHKMYI